MSGATKKGAILTTQRRGNSGIGKSVFGEIIGYNYAIIVV